MQPKYFILNNVEVLAHVYEVNNRTIIFMKNPDINVEGGIKFMDFTGKVVEDNDVKDLLSNFIFKKNA